MTTNPDGSPNLKFRPNRTFICSVVFIDIVEYSMKSVNEQIQMKERFNALLSEAIKDISIHDRIILDTGDGAAIGFLGDPEDALFVAMSLRDALKDDQTEAGSDLHVRMGINLGPVKLLKDINNQLNLIGDGINVAQRIMNFAEPGQLLVSRSYYDIVSCLSQEYAKLFRYQGARADKHVREHDIYVVEHTGLSPIPVYHKPDREPETLVVKDVSVTPPPKQPRKESAGIEAGPATLPVTPDKNKKMLFIGGGVVLAAMIALVLFIPRVKAPVDGAKTVIEDQSIATSTSERKSKAAGKAKAKAQAESPSVRITQTTPTVKKLETTREHKKEAFRAVSVRADDILFTVTGMRASGSDSMIIVRAQNQSDVEKSIALYDDAYRWTKSQLTDDAGKKFDVNTVSFEKASETILMSAVGKQGGPVGPRESVTIYMTFKKAGKGAKALNLHPFIYQGRSWKEHDLVMNLRR